MRLRILREGEGRIGDVVVSIGLGCTGRVSRRAGGSFARKRAGPMWLTAGAGVRLRIISLINALQVLGYF
jgi:hypothetical protein